MKISSFREEAFENHCVISHPSQFDASAFSSINSNSDDVMYFPGRNILEEFVSTAKTYPNDYSNGGFRKKWRLSDLWKWQKKITKVHNFSLARYLGVKSYGSIIRTASTASIVFVNCLITCICYGVLYNVNTNGFLGLKIWIFFINFYFQMLNGEYSVRCLAG